MVRCSLIARTVLYILQLGTAQRPLSPHQGANAAGVAQLATHRCQCRALHKDVLPVVGEGKCFGCVKPWVFSAPLQSKTLAISSGTQIVSLKQSELLKPRRFF